LLDAETDELGGEPRARGRNHAGQRLPRLGAREHGTAEDRRQIGGGWRLVVATRSSVELRGPPRRPRHPQPWIDREL
jgi:hypothetical protein